MHVISDVTERTGPTNIVQICFARIKGNITIVLVVHVCTLCEKKWIFKSCMLSPRYFIHTKLCICWEQYLNIMTSFDKLVYTLIFPMHSVEKKYTT